MSKKNKTSKKRTKHPSENKSKMHTDLDVSLQKPSTISTTNDYQTTKNSLKEDFSVIETKFLNRTFTDFQLQIKSRGFQNSNKLPELLDIVLQDPQILDNLGKELKLYWNNYQSSLNIFKLNYSNSLNLNNEIRNILHQNSQSESN